MTSDLVKGLRVMTSDLVKGLEEMTSDLLCVFVCVFRPVVGLQVDHGEGQRGPGTRHVNVDAVALLPTSHSEEG